MLRKFGKRVFHFTLMGSLMAALNARSFIAPGERD
jgi:hypothetical protein